MLACHTWCRVVSRRNLRYKSSIRYSDCRTARDSMASDRVSSTAKGTLGRGYRRCQSEKQPADISISGVLNSSRYEGCSKQSDGL
ncbi:hypothetical protein BSL78_13247 [Apostichopus japonicus]|uniref:Uncharacterized protein n=1 Tax=Stichopus japonicus TaxID=307972 RepID=A0A2G8KPE1_STIJA|nr:hypothetical protein BSL78_13247 [Apostichopus japonicus]